MHSKINYRNQPSDGLQANASTQCNMTHTVFFKRTVALITARTSLWSSWIQTFEEKNITVLLWFFFRYWALEQEFVPNLAWASQLLFNSSKHLGFSHLLMEYYNQGKSSWSITIRAKVGIPGRTAAGCHIILISIYETLNTFKSSGQARR